MEPIQIDRIVCDGYDIQFISPIEFEVHTEDSPDGEFQWQIASIDGFNGYSQCIGENLEDLVWNISDMIVGTLQFPPGGCNCDGGADEDYEMFFNFLKNSIESISWTPPNGMRIESPDGEGVQLEFV